MPAPNSVKIPRPSIFRNPWKRRRLVAGRVPATGRSPVGHPDAFHWERVTGWSPVGGRLAQWNAPRVNRPVRVNRRLANRAVNRAFLQRALSRLQKKEFMVLTAEPEDVSY